jgi:hypothetical protein
VPASARLLLEAADRRERHGEDRLTEVFATVLRGEPALLAWLASEALGVPGLASAAWRQQDYAIATQLWLSRTARPDMVIELSAHAGGNPLVAIVPTAWSGALPAEYRRVTWHQVAQAADAIGRHRAGRRWRFAAEMPTASAGQRLLHELVSYLERHAVDQPIVEPLSQLDLVTFSRARAATEAVRRLFELIARHPALTAVGGEPLVVDARTPATGRERWYATYAREWPGLGEGHGGWAELLVGPTDWWRPVERRLDEPALGAGYSFALSDGKGWPPALSPDSRWAADLREKDEIEVAAEDPSRGRVFRTIYLAEVMAHGADLVAQATWGATQAAAALERVTGRRP